MVDLRYEMDLIIKEFGDAALLLRSQPIRCGCVNSLSRAPDKNCKRCLGTGKIIIAEKISIRSKQSSSNDTLPKNLTEKDVGSVAVGVREFYTTYRIRAKQYDSILFCEWEGNTPIFNQYTVLYRILNTDPLKADRENGIARIEYFKLTSNSDPINVKAKFNKIIENAEGSQYYIGIKENE